MNWHQKQGGLIKTILLILILIIVLSYFNIDIKGVVESPQSQANLQYMKGLVVDVWDNYLSEPILYFWHNIFIDLLWNSFADNINNIRTGQPTIFDTLAPTVPSLAPNN